MVKKKKIARFRELYDYISELLESYNYDDTAKILLDEKKLDLTAGTLKNYIYRHRQELAKSQGKNDVDGVKKTDQEKPQVTSEVKSVGDSASDKSNNSKQNTQEIDLDSALANLKNKASNKSILDDN